MLNHMPEGENRTDADFGVLMKYVGGKKICTGCRVVGQILRTQHPYE